MEEEEKEFQQVTSNLHHLLSTKSCRGVFSSLYGSQYDKKAYNRPIESHIKENAGVTIRQIPHHKLKNASTKLNTTKLPAIISAKPISPQQSYQRS
jgi:hypothetical protein